MVTCNLCPPPDNTVPADDLLDHVRLFHPDVWDEGLDVVDMTLDRNDGRERSHDRP